MAQIRVSIRMLICSGAPKLDRISMGWYAKRSFLKAWLFSVSVVKNPRIPFWKSFILYKLVVCFI